jgi:hypothetical protein
MYPKCRKYVLFTFFERSALTHYPTGYRFNPQGKGLGNSNVIANPNKMFQYQIPTGNEFRLKKQPREMIILVDEEYNLKIQYVESCYAILLWLIAMVSVKLKMNKGQ